jgi:hypothetical protein
MSVSKRVMLSLFFSIPVGILFYEIFTVNSWHFGAAIGMISAMISSAYVKWQFE